MFPYILGKRSPLLSRIPLLFPYRYFFFHPALLSPKPSGYLLPSVLCIMHFTKHHSAFSLCISSSCFHYRIRKRLKKYKKSTLFHTRNPIHPFFTANPPLMAKNQPDYADIVYFLPLIITNIYTKAYYVLFFVVHIHQFGGFPI